ncbi:hypothetical protein ACH5RR_036020 [Cinchona calisaya]|uniref:Uncharacterized protein n=1 Tax=Cinchona calisaya TaxID=153742 RepID=A0ABD2Y3I0_9GENT
METEDNSGNINYSGVIPKSYLHPESERPRLSELILGREIKLCKWLEVSTDIDEAVVERRRKARAACQKLLELAGLLRDDNRTAVIAGNSGFLKFLSKRVEDEPNLMVPNFYWTSRFESWSTIPEHGFGGTIPNASQELIPDWLRSAQAGSSSGSGRYRALYTTFSGTCNPITVPDTASGRPFNRQETSNGTDVIIEILDADDHNRRGMTGMLDVYSRATNSTFASSSSCYELTDDVFSVPHFNRQETSKGTEVTNVNIVILKNDDNLALPRETKFQAKINNIILGITGQAAVAMVSPSHSTFFYIFAAATCIGFLGSFFANYILKKAKTARILSKIGAIGAVSAVIFALGSYFPEDSKWKLNMVATVAACFVSAVVVASS